MFAQDAKMECKQKVMYLKEQEQTDKKKSQNLEKLLDVISSSKLTVKTNLPGHHHFTKKVIVSTT